MEGALRQCARPLKEYRISKLPKTDKALPTKREYVRHRIALHMVNRFTTMNKRCIIPSLVGYSMPRSLFRRRSDSSRHTGTKLRIGWTRYAFVVTDAMDGVIDRPWHQFNPLTELPYSSLMHGITIKTCEWEAYFEGFEPLDSQRPDQH